MKKTTKAIIIAIAAALVITLVGCSKTPDDIIKKAQAATADIKNYEAEITMNLEMNVMEQNIIMLTKSSTTFFVNPAKAKYDMRIDMGSLGIKNTLGFAQQEGNTMKVYVNIDGQWVVQEITGVETTEKALSQTDYKLILKNFANFKELNSEKIDGKDVRVFEGFITGSSLKEVVESSGVAKTVAQGAETVDYSSLFSQEIADMPVKFWIDEDTSQPVKMVMDMSAVMNKIMSEMYSQILPDMNVEVKVSKCYLEMTIKNINKAKDFQIPQEALNATSMTY